MYIKNISKNEKSGITLIALVITIIVLLILAGISISMLSGDNTILGRATTAKVNTERQQVIETARVDILGKMSENKGSLSENELIDILTSANYNTQGTLSDEESILDRSLTSKDGKYIILVSEIYNGNLNSSSPMSTINYGEKTAETVEIGDDITIGETEKFKIIKKSSDGKILTAIPYFNIELSTNNPKQTTSSNDNVTSFTNNPYWLDTESYSSGANIEINESCDILPYIEAYETTLKGLGANNILARLGLYSEMNESYMTNELRNPRSEWKIFSRFYGNRF